MPAWFLPALKAVLPHVGTIISAATPVFTKKRANADQVLQQQISELQAAAAQNAGHIKELAAQLEHTVAALEQAASIAQSGLRRAWLFGLAATALSAVSLGLVLFLVFAR